ncbi:alpha/beta hydrolase [Roseovarius sp. LXJ103]|uniref:alpha/beta fold hydrolase n=1 Tax=Roseovarius carneus TaxID=2853164 RepID=UPI000D616DCF|nr:alpha/beta hydrolase [Roseovarius carneus]MBZ8119727.1 alpha/beta hydrolase [Roseovarius carneus]PWE34667.1 alpha/beta hydrolase [Pelagicola sp. LXJ1103]
MAGFTTSDGLRLHYTDEGTGDPVLCLAGLTRNSADFKFVLPFLAGHRVIRMDYRGRGLSDHAQDYMTYSIPQEAADAVALMDHLGVARATILGTSRGGLIAMVLAATVPDRLNGAILNDIGPEISPEGMERIMDYLGTRPRFADYDSAATGLRTAYATQFPGVPETRWRVQAEMMWCEAEDGLDLRYDARLRDAMVAQRDAGPAPDLWPLFDTLASGPLTVIRGANSDLLTAQTLAKMHARAPSMRSATVPDRGHVPFLDEAEALAAIHEHLKDFA